MISVVIRTLDEAEYLEKTLKILACQSIENEVIVVDTNSKDNTQKIAKDYNAILTQCVPFTYGKALNLGIKNAKYDYICALSAHCYPATDNFLLMLLNAFVDKAAGVYARQFPVKESNILDKRNLSVLFRSEKIRQKNDSFFNNAASMIRKDIWDTIKFDETVAAWEDMIWANAVQNAGYLIIYEPKAIVYHYHNESIEATITRYEKEYMTLKTIS